MPCGIAGTVGRSQHHGAKKMRWCGELSSVRLEESGPWVLEDTCISLVLLCKRPTPHAAHVEQVGGGTECWWDEVMPVVSCIN